MESEVVKNLYHNRARVVRVIDADTLEVNIDLGHGLWLNHTKKVPVSIRLTKIDAWEVRGKEKKRGLLAKQRVMELLQQHGNDVIVHTVARDNFGRWLADVWVGDGINLSDLLLEEGHAELYKK